MSTRILSTLAGITRFQSGIGDGQDLFVRLQEDPEGGWYPVLQAGTYYIGTEEGYQYASRGTASFTLGLSGQVQTLTVSGLIADPTRLGPIRLLRADGPRPLLRVTGSLRAFRTMPLAGSGDVQSFAVPTSGLLVSLVSDPVTGVLIAVPATGDILSTEEYTYDVGAGTVFLRDPSLPHLYATYLQDESAASLLRQEEILRVSTDGQVRTMGSPVLCLSGSVFLPFVKRPLGNGWLAALGTTAVRNAITLTADNLFNQLVRRDHPNNWWRMRSPGGPYVFDEAGAATGTVSGTVYYGINGVLQEQPSGAIRFAGAGKIGVGFPPVPTAMSLEAWVQPDYTTQRIFFSNRVDQTSGVLFGIYYGQAWFFDQAAGQGLIGTRNICDGRWHHLVVTSDGFGNWLYVDGHLETSNRFNRVASSGSTLIASDTDGSFFFGALDELALYPYPLTGEQVLDHFEAGGRLLGTIASGDIVACRYHIQDSFTAVPSGSGLQLTVLPAATGSFTLEYETGTTGRYYTSQEASGSANALQLNPLLTARQTGFLYLCDAAEPWPVPAALRIDCSNRNPLYNPSGMAPVLFSVTALDSEGEPIPQTCLAARLDGVSGALTLQYPSLPVTDGRGQVRYTWTPTATGTATVTALASGVSGFLDLKVRDIRHYTDRSEEQLGKLMLAFESQPYRGNLRRLSAYYCTLDGAPWQPDAAVDPWSTTVTFSAERSAFFALDGTPLDRPASLSTDADGVAQILVDPQPGDFLRAEVLTQTSGRKRTARPIRVPDLA